MKYKSQKVAYWFFALSMLLLVLQLTYGFIMGFARIGLDGLHDFIPSTLQGLFTPIYWWFGYSLVLWELPTTSFLKRHNANSLM